MIKVGITGGIGVGKSLICKLFQLKNIPVYDADFFAKHLMQNDEKLVKKLTETFGEIYDTSGNLLRKKLANIVFNDKAELQKLNAIVHPAVNKHSLLWMESKLDVPYCLREAALLFESGSHKQLDLVILVTAPKTIRIERVIKRDKSTVEAIEARINSQWSEQKKLELADEVIVNDDVQLLIPQVNALHKKLSGIVLNT